MRGYPRHGDWGAESCVFNGKQKISFYFLLCPFLTESLLSTLIHAYTWTHSVYTKIPSLRKAQEDSQGTGRNKGRLQMLKLLSQNCQLETYRMTLKSPRLSQSLKHTRFASFKAPTGRCQRGLRKATV